MRPGRRYGLSSAQKAEIWRRWKVGESLHEIGRACGKDHGSIHFLLSQHGGIVPAVRRTAVVACPQPGQGRRRFSPAGTLHRSIVASIHRFVPSFGRAQLRRKVRTSQGSLKKHC